MKKFAYVILLGIIVFLLALIYSFTKNEEVEINPFLTEYSLNNKNELIVKPDYKKLKNHIKKEHPKKIQKNMLDNEKYKITITNDQSKSSFDIYDLYLHNYRLDYTIKYDKKAYRKLGIKFKEKGTLEISKDEVVKLLYAKKDQLQKKVDKTAKELRELSNKQALLIKNEQYASEEATSVNKAIKKINTENQPYCQTIDQIDVLLKQIKEYKYQGSEAPDPYQESNIN